MTLPRELFLRTTPDGVRLMQRPIAELRNLRTNKQAWTGLRLTNQSTLALGRDERLEIILKCEAILNAEISLRVQHGGDQHTSITYDFSRHILSLDRTHSGNVGFHADFASCHTVSMPPQDGKVRLHVFVDRCSVEVFGNNGKALACALIFPNDDSHELEIVATGADIFIQSLTVFELQAAQPKSSLLTS